MLSVNIHIHLLQSKREQLQNVAEASLQILFVQMFANTPCPCALLPTLQQNIQNSVNKDKEPEQFSWYLACVLFSRCVLNCIRLNTRNQITNWAPM